MCKVHFVIMWGRVVLNVLGSEKKTLGVEGFSLDLFGQLVIVHLNKLRSRRILCTCRLLVQPHF